MDLKKIAFMVQSKRGTASGRRGAYSSVWIPWAGESTVTLVPSQEGARD